MTASSGAPTWSFARARRLVPTVALPTLLGALTAARVAPAQPLDKAVCLARYEGGQELRLAGKLLDARASFRTCAHPSCPKGMTPDCAQWLGELEDEIPTLLVEVLDEEGRRVQGLAVSLDGADIPAANVRSAATGLLFDIDPGEHRVAVRLPSGQIVVETLTLQARERGRSVTLRAPPVVPARSAAPPVASAPPPPVATAPKERARIPTAVPVLAGVGAVSLLGFGYFGLKGNARYDELRASCGSTCTDADSASVRRDYLAADISLAVSLLSFGIATGLWLGARADSGIAVQGGPGAGRVVYQRWF